MSNRLDLLATTALCAGLYAAWRVFITVIYPLFFGAIWQYFVGPVVVARWPSLGQSEDPTRSSYLPLQDEQPYVMRVGLLPPPIGDVTQGVRDGLLLGVFVALIPEIYNAASLTVLLAFVIGKNVWLVSRQSDSAKTDALVWGIREVLMYIGAVASAHAVGLLPGSVSTHG